jgi:hypothetical protein
MRFSHARAEPRRSTAPRVALALLAALGCSPGDADPTRWSQLPPAARAAREPAYIAQQQVAVTAKLRDPSRAEFRNVRVYYATGPAVCGEVSIASEAGGPHGYERFISAGLMQVLESEMAAGEMDRTWRRVCR